MGKGARVRALGGAVAAAAVAAALALGGPGSLRAAVLLSLYVDYVGTGCTFTISSDFARTVTTLAPGTYQIFFAATDFDSCAGLPDFQLTGPGVSIRTPIDAGTGNAAEYTVTFQPGSTYVALDLNQPALSPFTFTTQASGTPNTVVVGGKG